jgi:sulfur-oxidizing protein SoxY
MRQEQEHRTMNSPNPTPAGAVRRRLLLAAAGALPLLGATTARAAIGGLPSNTGHADGSPEWDLLRANLYGQREVIAGAGRVQLIAPLRAAYGASVPIKIVSLIPQSPALYVKRIQLLVDKNPSPLAATLDLGSEVGQADFETRIRVDEYSHVRVVSELSNGELHTDSRFVKTSGGCSAPPNRDSPELIGRTIFKLPEPPTMNAPTTADVTVIHPNDTGFELNNVTVMYIPSYFVRTINVSFAGRKVFDADLDFSISENPTWRFRFVPRGPGELRAEVADSKERHYTGSLRVG